MSATHVSPRGPSDGSLAEAEPVLEVARRAAHAERTVRARLLTIAVLVLAVVSLLLAVPGLRGVAREIRHVNAFWLILAGALELASCASFVVLFRRFFDGVAAKQARRLAWTEMGSGALLPGGGVGSLAVGGWLLHLAGMPTRRIVRSSGGLFFLTSAVNLLALLAGALMIATGLSAGHAGFLRVGLPILGGMLALIAILSVAHLSESHSRGILGSAWMIQIVGGVAEAKRVARRPSLRLLGAIGYLGFDIAVLWATLHAVGYDSPIGVLILGYIIGYLANLIPVPGAIGVLEGGIAGTLALYGAPLTEATAGVLLYHAIAFWIPGLGGLAGYRSLNLHLASPSPSPPQAANTQPIQSIGDRMAPPPHPPPPHPSRSPDSRRDGRRRRGAQSSHTRAPLTRRDPHTPRRSPRGRVAAVASPGSPRALLDKGFTARAGRTCETGPRELYEKQFKNSRRRGP
jgi:uncharacterized membrane protein YbhN (UPF0104 family)